MICMLRLLVYGYLIYKLIVLFAAEIAVFSIYLGSCRLIFLASSFSLQKSLCKPDFGTVMYLCKFCLLIRWSDIETFDLKKWISFECGKLNKFSILFYHIYKLSLFYFLPFFNCRFVNSVGRHQTGHKISTQSEWIWLQNEYEISIL